MNEIQEQGKALARMHGDTLELIEKHAAEFRQIIDDYKERFGIHPTADDFIYLASLHAGRDLTKESEK